MKTFLFSFQNFTRMLKPQYRYREEFLCSNTLCIQMTNVLITRASYTKSVNYTTVLKSSCFGVRSADFVVDDL